MSLATETKDKMATRDGFGRELCEIAKTKDFYVMSADLQDSTRTIYFAKEYPERYIECGIAEANMITSAAGMSTTGKPVVVSTYAMFAAGRGYDQIRNSVCYPKLNVKIAASHGGLSVGEDGATHQCLEDIALMRAIPNMIVLSPCDGLQAKKCIDKAIEINGPVYIRLARSATPVVTTFETEFEIGKGQVLKDGNDATIVSTGILTVEALKAAEQLESQGISVAVVNIHTIKPLDEELINKYAKKTNLLFTLEEHSILGGLGGAVCECVTKANPVKVVRIGVEDQFGMSGTVNELLDYYKLTCPHIVDRIKKELNK